MKAPSHRGVVIAGIVWLLGSNSHVAAGGFHHLSGRHSGCCGRQSTQPAEFAGPVIDTGSIAEYGCAISAAVPSCCGIGGGLNQLGNLYGLSGVYGVSPGGFTGYEGLPNMDGGGINHRYPYHSYRRPWAHPGPRATNVSIVW